MDQQIITVYSPPDSDILRRLVDPDTPPHKKQEKLHVLSGADNSVTGPREDQDQQQQNIQRKTRRRDRKRKRKRKKRRRGDRGRKRKDRREDKNREIDNSVRANKRIIFFK